MDNAQHKNRNSSKAADKLRRGRYYSHKDCVIIMKILGNFLKEL
jgi:hypothetical protein